MHKQLFSLSDVAQAIEEGHIKRIGVLVGAGISVNSGINDYRSAKGLYNTLDVKQLSATDEQRDYIAEEPSRVVSKCVFEASQLPFFEVKRKLVLDMQRKVLRPTVTHCMLRVLEDHKLLTKVYTQNIDCLEKDAGVSEGLVHNVHGSMKRVKCHYCGNKGTFEEYADHMLSSVKDVFGVDLSAPSTTEPLVCKQCFKDGMRPDVVLYGEALDDSYVDSLKDVNFDLLLILGTSLTVAPLSDLPGEVPRSCYRVVINNTLIGENKGLQFGRGRDVFVQSDCDAGMSCLASMLGWSEDLKDYSNLMSQLSVPFLSTTKLPEPADQPKLGKRIELLVCTEEDLDRTLVHSREAAIEVPRAELDFTSHITAGQQITIREFVITHYKQVKENMQMIMGAGTQEAVNRFLDQLEELNTTAAMPWYIVIDDPAGDAYISGRPGDTGAVLRTTQYALSAKEKSLMGLS